MQDSSQGKRKKNVEKSQVTDIRMKTKPSLCCGYQNDIKNIIKILY